MEAEAYLKPDQSLPDKDPLFLFKEEIAELKKREEEEKERGKQTIHFRHMNPDDLIEEDREMWEDFKTKTVDKTKFYEYRDKANASEVKSRIGFAAFLSNKIVMW